MHFPWAELWSSPALLLLIGLLSQWLKLPRELQPMVLLQFIASRLGHKVNPPQRSLSQQRLSGFLAVLTLVLPIWSVMALLYWFSDWPWLLDAMLLLICLDTGRQQQQQQKVIAALNKQQLSLARDLLQPEVLRDCGQLSLAGLCKASMEQQALAFYRQWLGVGFWFLLGGGLAALAYRLVLLCNQSWNSKQASFRHFGQMAAHLSHNSSLPAAVILAFWYGLLMGIRRVWRQWQQERDKNLWWCPRLVLACLAGALQVNLAGPVYYQGEKVRRDRLGPSRLPGVADVVLLQKLQQKIQSGSYLLLFAVSGLQLFSLWY